METLPDEALVEASRNGSAEAFGQLTERHYRMVWILAYQRTRQGSDADDLVQETFVRAYRGLPGLRDGARFASWVYNIALKLCIDWSRRRQRRDSTVPLDEDQVGRTQSRAWRRDARVGEALETADEHDRVLSALGELPDKYRLVLTLRYVRRMSYKEIAAHLGEPAGTVANRLHRAVRMLQQRLGADALQVGGVEDELGRTGPPEERP